MGEISNYRTLATASSEEIDVWSYDDAIDQALSFIASLPANIPLPKPMLLSRQVAIYWDFGAVYAEIDFDGSGHIDAYGKRPGVPEVYLDQERLVDVDGQSAFPTKLEAIISPPPEGLAVA